MRDRLLAVTCAILVSLAGAPAPAQEVVQKGGNLVEVTVTGAGMTQDDALRDAQRKAIERGAGSYIYSQSQTKDFALVKDTVLARSAGFIQSYDKVSQKQLEDGTWELVIKAVVSVKGIEDTWGVVTNLLQQMGRPKIMVFMPEKIEKADAPRTQELVDTPTVVTRIENILLESGFLLVDKNQLKDIDRKDLEAAVAEDSPARAQAVAKRFGAQLFITGASNAALAEQKNLYGVPHFVYQAEANVKCFRSDTGQLLSSIPGESTTGVDRAWRTAAKKALDIQAQQIAPKVRENILRFWMDALEGRGEVQLHVEGVTFPQYLKLKKALEGLKEVKQVNARFSNGVVEASIQSDVTAEKLAEKIVEAMDFLEVTDVSQNVIKGKLKGQ